MFNFLKRSYTGDEDKYPRNQTYGRHIDIKYEGYLPGE